MVSLFHVTLAVISFASYGSVLAACTSDLLIDDYSKFAASGYSNALGGWTSDDGSASAKSASGGILKLTAKAGGATYWYFAGLCGKTGPTGTYSGVSLTILPPAGATALALNLQTSTSCTGAVKTSYYTITLTPGQNNTIRVPFTSFPGANLANIISFNLESFSVAAQYSIGPVRFYCSAGSSSTSASVSSTTSSAARSSTTASATTTRSSTTASATTTRSSTTASATTTRSSTTAAATTTSAQTTAAATTSAPPPVSTSCLVIDNYAKFSSSLNALGGWSSDDGTMSAKAVTGGRLTVTAKAGGVSYYYFGGLCGTQAGNVGASTSYTGIYFTIIPPVANAVVIINLMSSTSCAGTSTNVYYKVTMGAANVPTTVQVPFSAFGGINRGFITSLNLEGFSVAGKYSIGPISYFCGTPPPSSTTTTTTPTSTPTTYPITKDGTCGIRSKDANGVLYRCPTSGNVCCSDTGLCGNNLTNCGITFYGCQSAFGSCSGPQPQPAPNSYPTVTSSKSAAWVTKCTTPGLFALTYDDGPSSLVGQLLTVLATNNVKATFFINAFNRADITVDPFKTFLLNAYNQGHQIASHTYDHLDMTTLNTQGNWAQMWRNDKAIAALIGKMPVYMRPPYGAYSSATLDMLGSWGYQVIWQNIDSLDFQYSGQPNALQLMQGSYDGSLVNTSPTNTSFISLQHDFVPETVASWTQRVIDQMKARGYRFVTVGECMGDTNPANWYRDVSQWPQWA